MYGLTARLTANSRAVGRMGIDRDDDVGGGTNAMRRGERLGRMRWYIRWERRTPNADFHSVFLLDLGEIGLWVGEIVGVEREGTPDVVK